MPRKKTKVESGIAVGMKLAIVTVAFIFILAGCAGETESILDAKQIKERTDECIKYGLKPRYDALPYGGPITAIFCYPDTQEEDGLKRR